MRWTIEGERQFFQRGTDAIECELTIIEWHVLDAWAKADANGKVYVNDLPFLSEKDLERIFQSLVYKGFLTRQ